MAAPSAGGIHLLNLHLIPLLHVIDFVLALLHGLIQSVLLLAGSSSTAPLADGIGDLLPILPSEITAAELVKLLRVDLKENGDGCVSPLLAILPVIGFGGPGLLEGHELRPRLVVPVRFEAAIGESMGY